MKKQCIDLLKDESIEGHDANLIQTYNKLILDWNARNASGVSELVDGYKKIVEAKNIEDITKLLTDKETVYDYYNFIDFYSDTGYNDPETYLVTVDTPSLLLTDSAEYSNRTEYGDMYYGLKKDMFIYMGKKFGMKEKEAQKHFDNAMDLETKLASKIYTTKEYYSDDYYEKSNNEMTFGKMSSLSQIFPLSDIITSAGYRYDCNYLVTTPKYLKYLDKIYTEANVEKIKSLLIVKYILSYSTTIDRKTYDKYNELSNKYLGQSGTLSDKEMTYDTVIKKLPDSMQIVYIKKYGREEDRKKMIELCQMVINTYRELLLENNWISDETKKYVVDKLDKITINAAYPEKFNMSEHIELIVSTFESMAYEKKVKIETKIEKNIITHTFNKEDIEHILSTLIDNAIKHTQEKKKVIIEFKKNKDNIEINVKNKGEEIPLSERDKIFDRFYRIDKSRNRNEKRYGLGLSIAKSTILKNKGNISVDYKEGFTIFKVKLPI